MQFIKDQLDLLLTVDSEEEYQNFKTELTENGCAIERTTTNGLVRIEMELYQLHFFDTFLSTTPSYSFRILLDGIRMTTSSVYGSEAQILGTTLKKAFSKIKQYHGGVAAHRFSELIADLKADQEDRAGYESTHN